MGLTLRGARRLLLVPELLNCFDSVELFGKGWRDSFSGSLWVWMLSSLPVSHFTSQGCWWGNGWLVGVNGCPQWFNQMIFPFENSFQLSISLLLLLTTPWKVLAWHSADFTWSHFSSQSTAKNVPVTCLKLWCAPNQSSALVSTLTIHWLKANPVATALQGDMQKLASKGRTTGLP